MRSLQTLGATVLRDTLLTIPEVVSLTLDPEGNNKIFWKEVPDGIDFPYIVLSYGLGGYDTKYWAKQQASEVTWRVVAVTTRMQSAILAADAIAKLQYMNPVLTGVTNTGCNGPILPMGEIFDRYPVQSHTFFEVGGFFRLDLSHWEA